MNTLSRIFAALLLTLFTTLNAHSAQPETKLPASISRPAAVIMTPSVLERFRTYSGSRTPAALTALFAVPPAATIRQQPEVALSDGATTVKITIAVGSLDGKAPNIAFNEAQLISLKRNNADGWDIVMLPAVGTWNASLIVLSDAVTREVPLNVAPPLPAGTDLSEKGFISFLGGAKAFSRPLLDLNDDGRRDYLDDYIFTANYLVRPSPAAAVPDAAQGAIKLAPGVDPSSDPHNVNNRNQRAREQSERLRGKLPVPGSPSVVPPGQ